MKLTTQDVIKEFKKVHGDKYNYAKVDYIGVKSKVIIICRDHGNFTQTPDHHKRGEGCPKCSGKGQTTVEVIEEFRKVHGHKYNYAKVKYINAKTPILISCPEHGEFQQSPAGHKKGTGCPKCAGKGMSTKELIQEFNAIHGSKYNYSKVEYINAKTPVIIICKDHGEFQQTPDSHKRGSGCQKCSGNTKLSGDEIIQQFREVHGNKYDYSNVEYINSNSKVIIACNKHGKFQQSPSEHKSGKGCPKCNGNVKLDSEEIIKEFKKEGSWL